MCDILMKGGALGNRRLIYETKLTAKDWLVLMTLKIVFSKITMAATWLFKFSRRPELKGSSLRLLQNYEKTCRLHSVGEGTSLRACF